MEIIKTHGTSLPLRFFRAWQDFMQNGIAPNPEFFYDDQPYSRVFASNYYEDFACDMFIHKLEKFEGAGSRPRDENGNEIKDDYIETWTARLINAYPYTVASIPYSAGPAQLVKATVGFYYEYSHLIHNMG